MKALFITGDHLRHTYLVYKFSKFFKNFNWIVEKREININHKKLSSNKLYLKHIKDFKKQEKIFFNKSKNFFKKEKKRLVILDRSKTTSDDFNFTILNEIKKNNIDIIFSYGCRKIDVDPIKKRKIKCFNIHGGILPKYKGVNTNFWPHVQNESNLVGITMHELSEKIDSGNIFQETANIEKKDTINSLSCKVIKNFCKTKIKKIFYLLKIKKKFKVLNFPQSIKFGEKRFSSNFYRGCK